MSHLTRMGHWGQTFRIHYGGLAWWTFGWQPDVLSDLK